MKIVCCSAAPPVQLHSRTAAEAQTRRRRQSRRSELKLPRYPAPSTPPVDPFHASAVARRDALNDSVEYCGTTITWYVLWPAVADLAAA